MLLTELQEQELARPLMANLADLVGVQWCCAGVSGALSRRLTGWQLANTGVGAGSRLTDTGVGSQPA